MVLTVAAVGDCGQVFKLNEYGDTLFRLTLNTAYNLTGVSFDLTIGQTGQYGYIVGYRQNDPLSGKARFGKRLIGEQAGIR